MVFKDNDKAIYLQIADGICDSVLAGSLLPGDRIPSVRDYASKMGVNANTVMRSYDYLDQKGIIFNRRGIGFFISEDAFDNIRRERRETFFNVEAEAYFRRMAAIGLTPEEVLSLYTDYLKKNKQ